MLRLEGISRIYHIGSGEVQALDNASLVVKAGEFMAIMGASGSGKSTLMNIIGCLDRPTLGQYYMADRDISTLPDDELAKIRNRKIGFIFQNFNLLPRMNVIKNIELPLIYAGLSRGSKRLQIARTALETFGLGNRSLHKPNELSGGQQQRVAIARALVTNPSILLADEPTGNLDSSTSNEVMKIFVHLNQEGKTIIMVTHEPAMAQFAHRIIRLKDGRIIDNGSSH
ncbi:MAG: ABC transporter ATP-binding protein [bacterium]